MKLKWLTFIAPLALTGVACTKKSEPETAAPAAAPAKAAPVEKEATEEEVRGDNPACFGQATGGKARDLVIGDLIFQGDGYAMAAAAKDPANSGNVRVGLISDIKESLPGTVANLKTFAAWMIAEKVDMVVVNGDVSYSQKEIEAVLRTLGAEIKVPTLVISGNKELARDFDLALTNVSAEHPHIINGNRVRSLSVNDVTFVTLPGYGRKNYTEPGACLYEQADVDAAAALLKKAAGQRVLVAHAAPLQEGDKAVDYMVDGKNVGDERVTKMLGETGTKFAIVGNIKEAGGRGATLAGKPVAAGEASEELVVNPGPADASPWTMLDNSVSHGMAAIMTIEANRASYVMKRVEAPKPAEAPAK